ncbi:MAG: DNA polymerase III subunit alpha, partial [Bacteroidia bacterium]|nr:DNA polymerase III subunit alpha [Bacteroidia bacterium]
LVTEDIESVKKLREYHQGNDDKAKVLKEALILEGSVRGTGVHAAGIIIAPSDLTDLIPMAISRDSDLLLTQYDGKVIEDAGVIKMDFLGLKNLTIIRDALRLIKQNHGIDIEIDAIPLDDKATLDIFARGETNGTFQFESAGMQKYLKELKPDRFEDLIAMNALYRPGPLAYIPNFINRKHGKEEVVYDVADMEEHLKDTYGITVYQEQVMLLSQKLANFTKGDADVLRKAMGKKDRKTLDKLKPQFIEGASSKGHDPKVLEKIWTDWEAFASYAFNKSHSTCYAFVAFQTGYLKAHYPGEYMSALLSNNQSNIDKVTFFMEECKRMGINVLGPDVNESQVSFAVNKKGEIRFGLGAIKGVGENAVHELIAERDTNGPFSSIFDLTKRVSARSVSKKTLEGLAFAGAFDGFANVHRAQYFHPEEGDEPNLLEKAIRYANNAAANENANQQSLFGSSTAVTLAEPNIPTCEPWGLMRKLHKEKEVVGMYLSGHPLDDYKIEFKNFVNSNIADIEDKKGIDLSIAGVVIDCYEKISQKNNKPYGGFTIEDYSGSTRIMMWSEDYLKYRHLISMGQMLYLKGMMKPRFNSEDQFELKVNSMMLLADVREKMVTSLAITIKTEKIEKDFVQEFYQLLDHSKGTALLKFNVIDEKQKIVVTATSRRFKINFDNDTMKRFDELEIDYRING